MLNVEAPRAAVWLAELKAHLRIEDAGEDALLAGLLRAATESVEQGIGQLLVAREVEQTGQVRGDGLRLLVGPAIDLVALWEQADDGNWVPVDPALARVEGGWRLRLDGLAEGAEVRARYRAGIGAGPGDVPQALRQAVVRLAAHAHAWRDSVEAPAMPVSVRQLLAGYRVRRLGKVG